MFRRKYESVWVFNDGCHVGGNMKAFGFLMMVAMLVHGPSSCNENLNKGLGEEKGYTRATMEKYRKDPKYFKGSSPGILEIWSRMDYVATAVSKQNLPGKWASSSDKLAFLQPQIQRDPDGKPFCVIHEDTAIVVLLIFSSSADCDNRILADANVSKIASGDLNFNRSDYWIYVLRIPNS
jgi:hypothetical protein